MAKGEKFRGFIKKAANVFPEIMDLGGNLVTGKWGAAVEDIGQLLFNKTKDSNPQISEQAQSLLNEFERDRQNFVLEGFKAQVDDRKDARNLYKSDNMMQKIFGIVFLLGYGLLSWYLLQVLIGNENLPELAQTMVTMIWTGTSTKLNTIVDFFFGGSMEKGK